MSAAGPARTTGRVAVRVVAAPAGQVRLARLECSGALSARLTPAALYLVGAGAHPLGGDRLELSLELAERARLTVRSSGATLARRGASGEASLAEQRVVVGDKAELCWRPEPGIAAAGARHVSSTVVELAPGARLEWREEVVLGRAGEDDPGTWWSRLRVLRGGRALLDGELGLGPAAAAWSSPSVLGSARASVTVVVVDPATPARLARSATSRRAGAVGALLPLAGPAAEIVAFGASLGDCREIVAGLLAGALPPGLSPPARRG